MSEWENGKMGKWENGKMSRCDDELRVERGAWSPVNFEQAAYFVIGLLAAGLRLFQLGLRPLNEGEAVQALAALRFVQGTVQRAPAGTVPLLFTGNVVGFSLLGAGDITARWLPALAGLALVLLPYGLRRRLGRGGALAASLWLALSPSAVYFSRSLDGAILVATCGLALAVGLIGYTDTRRPGYLSLAAAALGLGLGSGPGFYTLLGIGLLFGLLLYLADRLPGHTGQPGRGGWSSLWAAWRSVQGEKGLLARIGAVFLATFGLAATTFVLHPAGIGHAADLLATWVRSFLPEQGGQPAIYPLLLLLRYEPLILLLGLVEAGRRVAGRRAPQAAFPHTAFLAFWALAATLIITLAGHRPAGNVLLVVVPLALLAGQGMERAWRWLAGRTRWLEVGPATAVALGLLVFFYLQLAAYSLTSNTTTLSIAGVTLYSSSYYLFLAAIPLLLLIGLGVAVGVWRGPELVVGAGWLAAVVVLGLIGFRAAWSLNVTHAADPRELMIGQTTAPDVRLLVEQLEKLSQNWAGDLHTLPITVDAATGPVVAWYMRNFEKQTVVDGLSAPPTTAAVVTLARQGLPIGETFRGQGFPLRSSWLPWGLWRQRLIRWLLFTEGSLPAVDQEVVLWVAGNE